MRQVKVMASDGSATAGSETGSLDPSLPGTGYDTQYLHALPHSAPKKKYGDTLDRIINQENCHYIYRSHNQIIRLVRFPSLVLLYCVWDGSQGTINLFFLTHSNADSSARVRGWQAEFKYLSADIALFCIRIGSSIDRDGFSKQTDK